jgi:hypothetical protein
MATNRGVDVVYLESFEVLDDRGCGRLFLEGQFWVGVEVFIWKWLRTTYGRRKSGKLQSSSYDFRSGRCFDIVSWIDGMLNNVVIAVKYVLVIMWMILNCLTQVLITASFDRQDTLRVLSVLF